MKKMKNILMAALIVALVVLSTAACRELPTNGKLDNQWQILTIEYPDNRVENPEGTLYYCFYRDIVQLTRGAVVATANLSQEGSTLTMQFPYSTASQLTPWGLTVADGEPTNAKGPVYTVNIDHLSDRTLQMTTSRGVRITCRRY